MVTKRKEHLLYLRKLLVAKLGVQLELLAESKLNSPFDHKIVEQSNLLLVTFSLSE